MDRMSQTNIQIMSILEILSEIGSVFVRSRRIPIGARPSLFRFMRALFNHFSRR